MQYEHLIEIRDLSRVYKLGSVDVTALAGVNLDVKSGQFFGITGPSGSGKSTLLNLIAGLDTPTSGEIIVEGTAISDFNEDRLARYRRKKVGMVFQSFNLVGSYTAAYNVALPLYFAGVQKRKRLKKSEEMLKRFGLEKRKNHKPLELSGGEQQRVAIARALINEPLILLADEPTGNLDSSTASRIVDILVELNNERNLTVIMVSHEVKLLEKSANIIVSLRDGEITEINNIR